MISSPPFKLLVDPKAKPVAVHRASLVSVHRMAKVKKANLDRDVALGGPGEGDRERKSHVAI